MNLTLATTCNVLPRELRQFDMIRYEIHFPNSEWLIWAVPIPGYSTTEDVQELAVDEKFNRPLVMQNVDGHEIKGREFIERVKQMKSIPINM